MNTKKIIIGILIWPLGAFWLARRYGLSKGRATVAAFAGAVVLIVVLGAIGGSNNPSNKNSTPPIQSSTSSTTPAATTTSSKPAKPKPESKPAEQWELIVSQSSCQESPSTTSVNCSVGVKNRGTTAGLPTVYALYHYSDGSETTDVSNNGTCQTSDDIPAGQLGFVYFCHNYDPLKHDLLRAAVTLKVDAKGWPYVRVADPSDINWPDG